MLRKAVKIAKEAAKLQQALEQTNHMLKVLHGERERLCCAGWGCDPTQHT